MRVNKQITQASSIMTPTTDLRASDSSFISVLKQIVWPSGILIVMCLFQVLWFAAIWYTGATHNADQVVWLIIYTFGVTALVLFMPNKSFSKIRQIKDFLLNNEKFLLLFLTVLIFGVGAFYAYHQRVWPFDEENNFNAAKMVAEQGLGPFFANYADIPWLGQRHPPLTPLMYGLTISTFGPSLYAARLFDLLLATATVLVTYFLGRELYNRTVGLVAALLLISFPLVMRQATVAMTDIPVTFCFTVGIYLVLIMRRKPSYSLAIGAGVVIGLGLLSKYTMVFIFPVLFTFFLIDARFRRITPHLIVVGLVSGTMLSVWLLFAYNAGIFTSEKQMVTQIEPGWFIKNAEGHDWLMESIITKLPSAIGVYNVPLLMLGIWQFWQHKRHLHWFSILWAVTVSVLLLLTLPDHRYFMTMFPAVAIITAWGVTHVSALTEKATLLALLYSGSALYLFVDWFRAAHVFVE